MQVTEDIVKTAEDLLPTAMLERFRDRAGEYDAENRFFVEDLAELRGTGYLASVAPKECGGSGLSLSELLRAQRLLAAHAPATALGVNMHLVWVQVARFLHDRGMGGDAPGSLDWVLEDAVAGEIFAFGISEAGNDAVLMDAFSEAVPDGDDYRVSGAKIFTTLSPVWTRLGVHARLENEGEGPQIVFGFVRRDELPGDHDGVTHDLGGGRISHPGEWNPLGMRATQSWNTKLEGVRVSASDVAAHIEPLVGQHPLILGIFSSFSLLTAAVYAGLADRALELAEASTLRELPGGDAPRIHLDDPDTAARLVAAKLEHRASLDALEILARDVDEKRMRDDWPLALAACRNRVTDEARGAVDVAMRLVGSRGFQADSELARLYRDVLAGMFHPSSSRSLMDSMLRSIRG